MSNYLPSLSTYILNTYFYERIINKMDMFFKSLNIMDYVWCFIIGGVICIIAQILIDKTKITSARILVLFVTIGAILRWSPAFINTLLILPVLALLFQS